jgi:hypothetical protein
LPTEGSTGAGNGNFAWYFGWAPFFFFYCSDGWRWWWFHAFLEIDGEFTMNRFTRRGLLGAIAPVILGATSGCNMLSVPYFLFAAPEPKKEAEIGTIANKDKKKENKILILTYMKLDLRPEFLQADREIAFFLEKNLKELTTANKEKISIVSPRKVEDYKNQHPDWQDKEVSDIGKHFKADHVIYLEVNQLSMYEQGSGGTLYRGKADITVSLVDVAKPDESKPPQPFTASYPRELRMGLTPTDKSPAEFRASFLEYLGKRIAWKFTAHPTRDDFYAD